MYRVSLIFSILLFSCQDIENTPKPKDLIPEEKMVELLTEISLLQGARTYNRSILKEKGIDPKEYLWEKYDVDSLQFTRSNQYYAQYPEQYQEIYDSVKARLERLKVIYDTLREQEERRQDSLKKAGNESSPEKSRIRDSLEIQVQEKDDGAMLPPPVQR